MSATINITLFQSYFDAPVVQVPGRLYPVKTSYIPFDQEDRNLTDPMIVQERQKSNIKRSIESKQGKIKTEVYVNVLERIDQLVPSHERGDLLVFLSGINEIALVAEELKAYAQHTK
jgi:HrpA-like RNA helicase